MTGGLRTVNPTAQHQRPPESQGQAIRSPPMRSSSPSARGTFHLPPAADKPRPNFAVRRAAWRRVQVCRADRRSRPRSTSFQGNRERREGAAKLPETAVIREMLRSVAQTRSAISQLCSETILEVRLLHRIELVVKENAPQLDGDVSTGKPTAHVNRRETPPLFAPTQWENRLQRSNDGFHAMYYTAPAF